MPQNVPDFRFSEDAIKVRQFLYEYWCANGNPPNLRDSAGGDRSASPPPDAGVS